MDEQTRSTIGWAVAGAVYVGGLALAGVVVGARPLAAVAQFLIEITPGAVATTTIELLGKAAQPAAILGVATAVIVAAVLVGRYGAPSVDTRIGSVVLVAVTAASFALAGTGGVGPGESIDDAATTAMREKTAATTTPTVTPAASTESMLNDAARQQEVTVGKRETDEPFGFDFDGMPPRLTPTADHYVVDKQLDDPELSADEWELTVGIGDAMTGETSFALTDLIGHPDRTEQITTMACISNPVGGPLISTARWRGVPVIDLLTAAGVADDATDVITEAADGYSEAIPIDVIRERRDILVAYGVNGETLPNAHGFPARLLIPGRYGMKMTKWLTGLGATTTDEVGYWTNRGWTETAIVNTLSSIRAAQRRGDRLALGGLAFAGERGIERVEVSLDGGSTWNEATMAEPVSPHARRRWRYVTEREPGRVRAVVRATDDTGTTQTDERTPPHPNGATGWHEIAFDL